MEMFRTFIAFVFGTFEDYRTIGKNGAMRRILEVR